jgi:uncharacterized membrane protein
MVAMALALVYVLIRSALIGVGRPFSPGPVWIANLIPALAVIGLGVAGYLAFVETRDVAAICGPVGDCNAVQSSPYATLFGLLPVAFVGVAGYAGILAAWAAARFAHGHLAEFAPLALFGMALFGVLLSLHLTYVELFIIRAVCMWCLASAAVITLIMVLSLHQLSETLSEA